VTAPPAPVKTKAQVLELIRNLMALADQDNEEGRTSAHMALKLMKKHGFVITMASRDDDDAPAPSWTPPSTWASPAPRSSAPERAYPHWGTPTPPARKRWNGAIAIVADEVQKFFQTIDVLPRDLPVQGVQLTPAAEPGFCSCGRRFIRGELVSRFRPFRCARCVARR